MKPLNAGPSNAAPAISTPQEQMRDPSAYLQYVESRREESRGEAKIVLSDPKMRRVWDVVTQVADANVPVLISGESGTGKEVIARAMHDQGSRKHKPFVAVNCAALPAPLLESELFGFEKGSFTGAHQRHLGKFEQARGGTLLLDEITEMDPALQAKLLRVLQEREIDRIGGEGPIAIDVRIIATTNRNIAEAVQNGSFRNDLYYRLHVINIEIPALRERPTDIVALSTYFLAKYGDMHQKRGLTLSAAARDKLMRHRWPGNVRELENVLQRAVILATSNEVGPDLLKLDSAEGQSKNDWVKTLPIGRKLEEVETQFILATLQHFNGNRTHAAKALGVSLRTMRNKISEYTVRGIEVTAPTLGRAK